MGDNNLYTGRGADLQLAILAANKEYRDNTKTVTDLFVTKIENIVLEVGGIVQSTTFIVQVRETSHIPTN